MPNISVIVPVYKVEPYLHRCVDSILAQTCTDFQLILVDDGSPDSCGDICEEYARQDRRIHVIHQENGGLSAARNAGIDWEMNNGTSTWLAFVDSDDWVHPRYLELLLEAAEKTGCRISACGFYRSSGEELPESAPAEPAVMEAEAYYCGQEHAGITAVVWNKLYHRSLFQRLRYPVGKLHEDEFTTYQALYEAERIGVTPVRLYAYYQNPNGIMRADWSPRRMDMLEAFEQQIAFAQRNDHPRLLRKTAEAIIYSSYEQLKCAPGAFRKKLRRLLRRMLKLGRQLNDGLGFRELHWAYEAAYPCKVLWWLMNKVRKP